MKNVLKKTYSCAAILTLSIVIPDAAANPKASQQQQAARAQTNSAYSMSTVIKNNKIINQMRKNGLTPAEKIKTAKLRAQNALIISKLGGSAPPAEVVNNVGQNQGGTQTSQINALRNNFQIHSNEFSTRIHGLKLSATLKSSLESQASVINKIACTQSDPTNCLKNKISLMVTMNQSLQEMLSKGAELQWRITGSDADLFLDTHDVQRGKVAAHQPRAMNLDSFSKSGHQYIGTVRGGGSGSLVAPDLVLTVAHVFNAGHLTDPSSATFESAFHPENKEVRQIKARAIHTFGNYYATNDPNKDIALMSLVSSVTEYRSGVAASNEKEALSFLKSNRSKFWLGYPVNFYGWSSEKQKLKLEGFPVDFPHVTGGSTEAFSEFGDVQLKSRIASPVGQLSGFVLVDTNDKIFWSKDLGAYGGNSGGPLIVDGKIVGVMAVGFGIYTSRGRPTSTASGARILTDDVIAQINGRLKAVQ